MIYNLLKSIAKIALFFFYKKVDVFGKSNIPKKGPLIIVANHPSTVIDPLIITTITKQRIGFIAKAGIFKNKIFAKILTYLHIIPIYRKMDVPEGEKPDNASTFVRCHAYLEGGGTFLIFPEGSSYYELKLREIKTGTARIALSYEELNNFVGNLKILPVALDYSDSIQFRTSISVTIGSPINVSDFKETYSKDNISGVRALTERIKVELAKSIPHTDDKNHEEFLIKLHKFYVAYFDPIIHTSKSSGQALLIRNSVSKVLSQVKDDNVALYEAIQLKLFSFFDLLKEENISTGFFSNNFLKINRVLVLFNYFFKFIFLFPFYSIGLIANYIPYILPYRIFKLLKIDIEYKTSVQMVVGIFTFPLFYTLEIWLLGKFVNIELWMNFVLPILFILSGYIAMYYWIEIKRFSRIMYFYFFMKVNKKEEIVKMRNEILNDIEEVRKNLIITD